MERAVLAQPLVFAPPPADVVLKAPWLAVAGCVRADTACRCVALALTQSLRPADAPTDAARTRALVAASVNGSGDSWRVNVASIPSRQRAAGSLGPFAS